MPASRTAQERAGGQAWSRNRATPAAMLASRHPCASRLTTGQLREENITQTKQAQELAPTTLYLLNGT